MVRLGPDLALDSGRITGYAEVELRTEISSRVGGGALSRWPPSASQTARARFVHAAFTKT
jgi:hypothetical protein